MRSRSNSKPGQVEQGYDNIFAFKDVENVFHFLLLADLHTQANLDMIDIGNIKYQFR